MDDCWETLMMETGPVPLLVTAEITFDLAVDKDHGLPVPCLLGYSAEEPLSVRASFDTGGTRVQWVFARDILVGGLEYPTGHGDVTCWPVRQGEEDNVCLSLTSPSGAAALAAPAEDIRAFLDRTFEVVPLGREAEFLGLDAVIADLLSQD